MGRLDESTCMMKNLLFIHEYVGESVSTCLESHANISSVACFSSVAETKLRGLQTYA